MSYRDTYAAAQSDPDAFWLQQAQSIDWLSAPTTGYDAASNTWFADAMGNTCYNCIDRHVEAGRGTQIAIIYDSPVTNVVEHISYADLLDRVSRLAGVLHERGVLKGDRVVIYMPMVPEAMIAMLACARIGAVHSVVFGGFAAPELAVRLDDCAPKAVIAGSCGIEPGRVVHYKPLLDAAIELAQEKPEFCLIHQRDHGAADLVVGRDFDMLDEMSRADPAPCVPVAGSDPAYILYTSGTTGQPKGVVRPTAGHMVALNWSMKNIYDVGTGDVFWAASDVGWVVGHSYICYGPLLAGCTTVVFEGKPVGTPDAGTFWRVIADHKVKSFFTAPTAFRAIKRDDPKGEHVGRYDLSHLKTLYFAGERADPDTVNWAGDLLGVPVVDHWWQTETGWAIAANPIGLQALPIKVGSPSVAVPGYDIQILSPEGEQMPAGELGAVAIKLPLPPGTLPTLWNADERYKKSYLSTFPGYYETGDAGMIDEDGYLYIMARTDDVINVAGHRLSTGAMEEILAGHPDVAECAVIGAADALKGQLPIGFLCLSRGVDRPEAEIVAECVARVRQVLGPVAAFKSAVVVERLPKTRSGKILRGIMARIADGTEYKMPATIDDPAILSEISDALSRLGYAGGKSG
ncbi:propionyl-CoA synthetase [Monaibacterium marinum]|uniref:Propionyl-CoA synthetase n=1 Tax=Pontivivens marinum TaxID=1690039 RepID=A0A2C9CRE4_9RHOB|nr:AMP-binding protein [Monaibacterium marinum]SOH94121.1 propionyl-CoA synthetase [Monaibacterium marinum]